MDAPQNLLQEIEQEIYLEPASKGVRLLNYIIDIIAFYAIGYSVTILLAIIILSQGAGSVKETSEYNKDSGTLQLALFFGFIAIFLAYYTLMEGFTKGRTIGKFITGTQAVGKDGSTITFKQAFIRSITRFVPFEPFSALGNTPWHDSWADTVVIKKKRK